MAFPFVTAKYASWDHNPEYIQACRISRCAGDSTAYTPAHPVGASATDVTTFKTGIAGWNESNLPDIIYDLWPCEGWKGLKSSLKPDHKRDQQGKLMYERYPRPGYAARPILDWPILRGIDKISTKVPWWLLELWSRLEPRLEWADIDMLMENVGQRRNLSKQHFINSTMNNRCSRTRQAWTMLSWREKSKLNQPNVARDTVLERLSQAQKNANTTRGSTPGLDLHGNRIPMPGRQGRNTAVIPQTNNGATVSHKQLSTRTTRAAPRPETDDDLSSLTDRDSDDSNSISDFNAEDSEDSCTSENEHESEPSQTGRRISTSTIESVSKSESSLARHRGGKLKRLPDPVHPGMPEKRRRIDEGKDEDEVKRDSLSRQALQHRRPKFVQEVQSHREHRQWPRSTTWSIRNKGVFPHLTPGNSWSHASNIQDTGYSANLPDQSIMDSLAATRSGTLNANISATSSSAAQQLSPNSSLPVELSTSFANEAQKNPYSDPSIRKPGNWELNQLHAEFMALNKEDNECGSSNTTQTVSRSFSMTEAIASAFQEPSQQEAGPELTVRENESSFPWDSNPLLWGTEWVSFITHHDAAPLLRVLHGDEI